MDDTVIFLLHEVHKWMHPVCSSGIIMSFLIIENLRTSLLYLRLYFLRTSSWKRNSLVRPGQVIRTEGETLYPDFNHQTRHDLFTLRCFLTTTGFRPYALPVCYALSPKVLTWLLCLTKRPTSSVGIDKHPSCGLLASTPDCRIVLNWFNFFFYLSSKRIHPCLAFYFPFFFPLFLACSAWEHRYVVVLLFVWNPFPRFELEYKSQKMKYPEKIPGPANSIFQKVFWASTSRCLLNVWNRKNTKIQNSICKIHHLVRLIESLTNVSDI